MYDKLVNGHAAVAQVVAHLIGSEEVTGSTPVSSFLGYIAETLYLYGVLAIFAFYGK